MLAKAITIGTFDGVHIGHQKILRRVIELAKQHGLQAAVLTLFPHPRMVLQKEHSIKLLNTIEERISKLKAFGIACIEVKEFTTSFANLSAVYYAKNILADELNAKIIVVGYDHHFGKGRSANITDLKLFGQQFGFSVEEISAQDIEDVTVSSTKIRTALNAGQVALANSYLGYNYFLTGTVVKGKGIGRTIAFPTANIDHIANYKLIPKDGVYVVSSTYKNMTLFGIMNIGDNPTVADKARSIEVHFFDFSEDIYDKTFQIEFLKRLRKEEHFDDLDQLKMQLIKDKQAALNFIETLD